MLTRKTNPEVDRSPRGQLPIVVVTLALSFAKVAAAQTPQVHALPPQELAAPAADTAPATADAGPSQTPASSGEIESASATQPTVDPSPEAPSTQLTDEDLGALEDANPQQLLKFYGFGDLGYRHFFERSDSPWFQLLNRKPSFFVGNLNLYFDAQLSAKWRALAEVRFTYLPHGAPDTTFSTPLATRRDQQVADYTDFSRDQTVGGIVLERATLEYAAFPFLTIKAGHWLTPYGIWNVDHGSPVIIGVTAPFIIGAKLFPPSQVGLLAQGSLPIHGDLELAYALGVSNGRVDKVPFEDLDGNKAITARAALVFHGLGEATLGGTLYTGRATQGVNEFYFVAGKPHSRLDVTQQFDELSVAADLSWEWQRFHFQTEGLLNDRRYTERGRPRSSKGALQPDTRNVGWYALLGYRTTFLGTMPYAKVEHSAEPELQSRGLAERVTLLTAGLNLRPEPRVVLKAEYSRARFTGAGTEGFTGSTLQGLDMQAAWAF